MTLTGVTTKACAASFLRQVMRDSHNDDLLRSQRAFDGLDLDEQHGDSGQTRREILHQYSKRETVWNAANLLLESMLRKEGL